ncbi:hypothetical protein [Sphingobacterium sp. R2]|uniref:hypothetical protein n=1 Tax=Sphingobacterium sp. R2 TaxID=3112958 RepID=UPI00345CC6F2
MELKTIAAFYSAILSTLLAINTWWKSRIAFDTTYFFTGEPNSDDVVVLYNKSSKHITITYFEFLKGTSKNDPNMKPHYMGIEGSFKVFSIAPNQSLEIKISDQYKFGNLTNTKIFLELNIMGKKKGKIIEIYPK